MGERHPVFDEHEKHIRTERRLRRVEALANSLLGSRTIHPHPGMVVGYDADGAVDRVTYKAAIEMVISDVKRGQEDGDRMLALVAKQDAEGKRLAESYQTASDELAAAMLVYIRDHEMERP